MEKAYARDEGLAEGHEIGLAEGRSETQRENAAKMKELGIAMEHIVAVTGLSEEEILKL